MAQLTFEDGQFKLDGGNPYIAFTAKGAKVGCHDITTAAMDSLTKLWQEYRTATPARIISSGNPVPEMQQGVCNSGIKPIYK